MRYLKTLIRPLVDTSLGRKRPLRDGLTYPRQVDGGFENWGSSPVSRYDR